MTTSSKQKNHPRSPISKKQKNNRGVDTRTIILAGIAGILLLLNLVFSGRKNMRTVKENTEIPTIERVENVVEQTEMIELDTPEQKNLTLKVEQEENIDSNTMEQSIVRLFFVKVSDGGKIGMKSVLRNVTESQAPMTMAIKTLLEGPRPAEFSNDTLSLIPEGSLLLGARVENGIAFLDFNEEFRFNDLGIEGYRAQVEQVVFTASEFPTVDAVQILIEGKRIDYLGGEGFWVGEPLSRDDF